MLRIILLQQVHGEDRSNEIPISPVAIISCSIIAGSLSIYKKGRRGEKKDEKHLVKTETEEQCKVVNTSYPLQKS